MRCHKFSGLLIGGIFLLAVLLFGLAGCAFRNESGAGELQIHVLAVGQADASLIQWAGKTILIDSGDSDGEERLCHYLRQYQVETIDILILTHPHEDHIGGAPCLLRLFSVGQIYENGMASTVPVYLLYRRLAKEKGIPVQALQRGDTLTLGDLRLHILSPPSPAEKQASAPLWLKSRENNFSLICRLEYGNFSMLFTGDAEKEAETELVRYAGAGLLAADVLKAGHHGSRTATTAPLLAAVRPRAAIISCGVRNSFGFPHQEVTASLNACGADIYRTDRQGTVSVCSDGCSFYIQTEHP